MGSCPANSGWLTSAAISKFTGARLRRDLIDAARRGRRTHGQATKRERQENHAHWYAKIAFTGSGPKKNELILCR